MAEVVAHQMKCPDCKKEWEVSPIFPPKDDKPSPYFCHDCNRRADLKRSIWDFELKPK